ncbi:filaggrin-2-like [Danaus plexippus]|uniref:filaggrin-2-like n=1 Tax=Danaus plexippus TaxID=13037 RepID=UPI002AB04579|nr:filaggrin-2-like [Danaus plexippus]
MRTAVVVLCVVAGVAAVQVGYLPAATSYVYRSDSNGPAHVIEVGSHGYQQPQAFAPLPVKAYDIAPLPLPYVAAKPIVIEDAEEDDSTLEDSDEGDEGYLGHDDGHESGTGNNYNVEHHSAHGEKGSKGHHSKGHHEKGIAGHYGKQHKEGSFHESEGGHKAHHDEADAHGKHHQAGESYKGGDHGHKKHFSKGEEITGYHKVFNKDEFKKDHDFYDVADDSGSFKKHGYNSAHHGSEGGAHKEGGHGDSGYNKGGFGKAGFKSKGYVDESDASHSKEDGEESHYKHGEGYGKKGGSHYEKEYEFNDDSDKDGDHDE